MSEKEEKNPNTGFAMMEKSRATPVRPAIWMTGVLVWATVIALVLRVPTWAGIFLCVLTGVSFLLYLVFYIYLMFYDREALRRERLQVKDRQSGSLVPTSVGLIGDQTQSAMLETLPLMPEKEAVIKRSDA